MLSRKYSLLVSGLVAAVVLAGAFAQAGTVSIVDITGDADCGISSTKTYTHTFDFGRTDQVPATVNGVLFTVIGRDPSQPTPMVIYGDNFQLETFPVEGTTTGFNYPFPTTTTVPETDGIYQLLVDGLYSHGNHTNAKATLSGLTPGQDYDLRLYYRPRDVGGTRPETLYYDIGDDGSIENSQYVDEDAGDAAHYISYAYTAPSNGIVSVDVVPGGWCWYGLTNEVAGVVPEPSTLALLACGLFGLLAYAWKKRR
ncbi:MAG: PEP-CTERM sorting domain-containing protein [Pirellulaceae bacterium]|nr:PEP-CTERM sorting domain-containing protein [Pirellulaceae bacterium]